MYIALWIPTTQRHSEDRELNQPRSKPDTVDQHVRTARTFVHHYNGTHYCTATVLLILAFLQTITSQMWQSGRNSDSYDRCSLLFSWTLQTSTAAFCNNSSPCAFLLCLHFCPMFHEHRAIYFLLQLLQFTNRLYRSRWRPASQLSSELIMRAGVRVESNCQGLTYTWIGLYTS